MVFAPFIKCFLWIVFPLMNVFYRWCVSDLLEECFRNIKKAHRSLLILRAANNSNIISLLDAPKMQQAG
jgi:hypothetical protein